MRRSKRLQCALVAELDSLRQQIELRTIEDNGRVFIAAFCGQHRVTGYYEVSVSNE